MNRPIEIVGGGLGGLALGVGLRRREIPVTLWEAGTYPCHRVCGEFLSGRGLETLDRLGLKDLLLEEGARHAVDTLFSSGDWATPVKRLPQPALCLSRHVMDQTLAREFARLGGNLRSPARWKGEFGEGVISAVGRGADRAKGGRRYVGLKAHAHRASPVADLEMHFVPSGYVGLCRLSEETVNVCGLFRTDGSIPDLADQWRNWLRGPKGSRLHARLFGAEFEEDSFCATAGFSLEPRRAADSPEIRIGDALTMIPPLSGNGMSMAFESAELAIDPIARFTYGEIDWSEARCEIAQATDQRFERRLRWASRFHRILFLPVFQPALISMASRSNRLWETLFSLTR